MLFATLFEMPTDIRCVPGKIRKFFLCGCMNWKHKKIARQKGYLGTSQTRSTYTILLDIYLNTKEEQL